MKISIIIPVFNEESILEILKKVNLQKNYDLEIIISDDVFTDKPRIN